MKPDRRSTHRIKTKRLRADIFQHASDTQETALDAEIIDISRSGIRIKLKTPLQRGIGDFVKITMLLPDSGNPFTIHGKLSHQQDHAEYGIHYTEQHEQSIDDMLFECIQLDDSSLLIKQ